MPVINVFIYACVYIVFVSLSFQYLLGEAYGMGTYEFHVFAGSPEFTWLVSSLGYYF